MYSYIAYGLSISSELPLPELVPCEQVADVVIRLGRIERLPTNLDYTGIRYWSISADRYYYYLEGVGTFLVQKGREIVVDPEKDVGEQILRAHLLSWILGVLLHQRGLLVLHASAVMVNGVSVAFLGRSGWGKSTTAAALHKCGYHIVADDIVALEVRDAACPLIYPAFPRIKLCSDAAISLGVDFEKLTIFDPQDDRREYFVPHEFLATPLSLKRMYVLAEGTPLEIEVLGFHEAFEGLVDHSHATVLSLLRVTDTMASHFYQCWKLLASVPICRLKRQFSLSTLPKLTKLIEEDITRTIYSSPDDRLS